MKDAGYTYFVLDDGWMAMERDKDGNLVADPKKFPNGMKAFSDYVHSKGLSLAFITALVQKHAPVTPAHAATNTRTPVYMPHGGVDYLKFDWCNAEGLNAREAYTTMSKAIRAAGRPMIFSLCEWGGHQPWRWAKMLGNFGVVPVIFMPGLIKI